MLENLIATLKSNPRTIVFTEGPDPRILEAASRLKKDGILTSILIGKVDEVKAAIVQVSVTQKFKQAVLSEDLTDFLEKGENNLY